MFIVRSSYRGYSDQWESYRAVFFVIIMSVFSQTMARKAVIDWSPDSTPFREPMLDHAAMIELQLLDRIVFTCDKSWPAVIYKVSEESFANCKQDMSAQWIGECSGSVKYITISMRTLGIVPTQPVFYANNTYFFTSFSSGSPNGIHDIAGGLCDMGVRLILEVRDASAHIPVLPKSSKSVFEERQVPVQRVSYGGHPTKAHDQDLTERKPIGNKMDLKTHSLVTFEEEDGNGVSRDWPRLDKSARMHSFGESSRIQQKRRSDRERDGLTWDPLLPPGFFDYSSGSATTTLAPFALALVVLEQMIL